MNIKTQCICPPIPIRDYDWCAVDDDTYDGPGCQIGYGATEQEAINDLLSQTDAPEWRGPLLHDKEGPICEQQV